jgi:light-regulated signal transduction histidine kinase (bacteriophytochrome)
VAGTASRARRMGCNRTMSSQAPEPRTTSPDDSDRRQDDLARRAERLTTAMRESESLAFALSHDFRTPLTSIERTARAMSEVRHAMEPEIEQGLRSIRSAASSMQTMIANLLELCDLSGQPLEPEPIDMEALAREAWSEVDRSRQVNLSVAKLPPARGHRGMLKLVWKNLLTNAVRNSAQRDRPSVQLSGGGSGDFAIYAVRDNGAALDLGYSGKLLYVFEQIQKQSPHPGTGVGLAVVQRIVTRHHGNVWVEARRNEGAFFQFSIFTGEGRAGTKLAG